jgi:predicted dienelactone hydrolase
MMNMIKRIRRILFWLVSLSIVGLLVILGVLWMYRDRQVVLPTPGGPYPVGRIEYDWMDANRVDPLGDTPGQPRKLSVWIWYPGERTSAPTVPAPYLPPAWVAAREQDAGIGRLLMQNLVHVQDHSFEQLPLSADKPTYPLLIMQPGLGPVLADYTTLCETLASYGYIVVGSTPTGSAGVVVFQDGDVSRQTQKGNVPDSATLAETHRLLANLIQVWAADDRFILDQVIRLNTADPANRFTRRMNLDAVGVLGHSFGGATAAQFCSLDPRCKAGADLDGYPYGDVTQAGLHQPFLFVWSETGDPKDAAWLRAQQDTDTIFQGLPQDSLEITIKGTRHFNFLDYAVEFEPVIRLMDGLGPIDGIYGLKITTTYVRAFFDETLCGIHDPLLDNSRYPEVQIIRQK